MKFSSIIRRALKPLVKGRKIKFFPNSGCWALTDEKGSHTVTNVHIKWKTVYGEDWRDNGKPTYMVSVRAVDDKGIEIMVDLPTCTMERFDRISDEKNHKAY